MSMSIRNIIIAALILCFTSSVILAIWNIINVIKSKKNIYKNDDLKQMKYIKIKKVLVGIALIGILVTPFIGASVMITHKLNDSIPSAGLELLSNKEKANFGGGNMPNSSSSNTKLIEFLQSHKTNEKYSLVVSSSRSAQNMIIQNGESVMALGGFSGSDSILTLDQFKELVKKGEVRYVLSGGMGMKDGGSSEIMNWVAQNGKAVLESEWKESTTSNNKVQDNNQNTTSLKTQNSGGFGGNNSEQLYDLEDAADTLN
jgi:4-amino-4-deoxy-L-arabinose transferase-like glycosyltransferase